MPPKILVHLPPGREKAGQIWLYNSAGALVAGPFTALGRADGKTAKKKGNPSRSPLAQFGDTPTGTYKAVQLFKVGAGTDRYPARSYGDFVAIRLQPTDGDAKLAADIGRTGLLIHGGDLGAGGRLRPTNGCIRLSNADIKRLVEEIVFLKATEGALDACTVAESPNVIVQEIAPDEGYDEGDPPPDETNDVVLP